MSHRANELTEAERKDLGLAVADNGQVRVAAWCGISRGALMAAIAGAPVRAGTVSLIRLRTTGFPRPRPAESSDYLRHMSTLHHFAPIVPSDTVALSNPSEFLYVGVAGDVAIVQAGDLPANAVVLKNLAAGIVHHLPFAYSFVKATLTTATNLVQMH